MDLTQEPITAIFGSPLEALPVELLHLILERLHNVSDLKSAVGGVPALFQAYLSATNLARHFLLKSALLPEHEPEIEAIAQIQRISCNGTTANKLDVFLTRDIGTREQLMKQIAPRLEPSKIPLELVSDMESLREAIRFFVPDFAHWALSDHILNKPDPNGPVQLSPAEYARLCHAFCRFDVLGRLVMETSLDAESRQLESINGTLGSRFAPWEAEQLASFEDVAAHDVEFGARGFKCFSYPGFHPHKNSVICRGLVYIRQLTEADSYDERLLIRDSLSYENYDREDLIPLEDFTGVEEARYVPAPAFYDSDPGPETVWRWAHQELDPDEFVYHVWSNTLRRRAYVMWDWARCQGVYDLQTRFDSGCDLGHEDGDYAPGGSADDIVSAYDFLRRSIERREQIWDEGAPLNILIVGCSVAGPTLATFLLLALGPAADKPHITILERAPALRAQGQNVDVRGAGVTIVRKLGLETLIRASTTGEAGVRFVDVDDRIRAAFAADPTGKTQTPTSDIEILRGRLAELLWRRSEAVSEEVRGEGGSGIEFVFGDYLDELSQDEKKVRVRFAKSGERRSFDLVVGADGLQSRTRSVAWGAAGERDRVYRLGMYGAFFSMPKGDTDSEWRRWFHATGRRSIMLRLDEQHNRTTAFVAVINERDGRLADVATKGRAGMDAQKGLLEEYFRDAGWESARVIKEMKATKDFYYDMVAQVKMDRWSKGRVVLLGDAAYCASPISGMGTTLALSGAYNLAGALIHHPDDHATAFAEYEKSMRPTVDRAQRLPPGMPNLFNPETAWGIQTLHAIAGFLVWSGLFNLLIRFAGPPADLVPVEEYGFKQLPELTD